MQDLKTKADIVFSRYVRAINADYRGYVKCYTCDIEKLAKEMENGHFVPRSNMNTRYSLLNCKPQCFNCNHTLRGNLEVYRKRLIEENDIETIECLESAGRQAGNFLDSDLKDIISTYTKLLKKWK